jgi:hypothetical protein
MQIGDPGATRAYGRYLAGKRVVLVGPAPTVEGSGQRDLIESHDVVVRINHALPVPAHLQPDVGCRTDVLYHNLWRASPKARPFPELVALIDGHVQWVCAVHPYVNLDHPFADDIDRFVEDLAGRVPFRVPGSLRWLCTRWDCGTRPNAGVSAIADLLGFDLARLYVTGFTFYTGPRAYHDGYRGNGIGPEHDQDGQRAFIARLLRTDARLAVDDVLSEVLAAAPAASTGGERR